MRATRHHSTLGSLVEVAVFFCVITPLFFLLCYGVYHAIHGQVSRSGDRTAMTTAMTTAQQASERVPEVAKEAEVIEKDEKLADAILDLSTALSTTSDDPVRTAQSFRRVADAARRKARNDADALEEAEEYADSTAKTAAETLLADVLDRATTLHLAAAQAKAEAEKLKTIAGEIRSAHEEALAEAEKTVEESDDTAEKAEARQLIADLKPLLAEKELREALIEARKTVEESDDPAEKAKAQQLIADLEPLLAEKELTDMLDAFEAVEPKGQALAKLTDEAQERARDVIKGTIEVAQKAGKEASHATDKMIANRFDAWVDIAATSKKVQTTAREVEELSARATEMADTTYLRLKDRLGPGAKDIIWQIKRAEVAAARAARRSARTIERCREVRRPLLAPAGREAQEVHFIVVAAGDQRQTVSGGMVGQQHKVGDKVITIPSPDAVGRITVRHPETNETISVPENLLGSELQGGDDFPPFVAERPTAAVTAVPTVEGDSARRGLLSLLTLGELFGSMPWWMWVIEGGLYLLLVNGYWISGDSDLDRCEVRAFGVFALMVAAGLLVVHWRAIVRQIDAFLGIVGGQG
jgi:hypothetical protein